MLSTRLDLYVKNINRTRADNSFAQTLANSVLITRLKRMPKAVNAAPKDVEWELQPALKVCITMGLSRKEIERAGITIRHAITKVVNKKR